MQVQSLDPEDPLEEGMATHSSIFTWKIPWTEEPGGLQPTGVQSQTQLKWLSVHAHTHTHTHRLGHFHVLSGFTQDYTMTFRRFFSHRVALSEVWVLWNNLRWIKEHHNLGVSVMPCQLTAKPSLNSSETHGLQVLHFSFSHFLKFLFKNIFNLLIFNWRIITVWYCFCHTSTWISHRYTYVVSVLNLPLTSHHSRLSQSPGFELPMS